jgi:hypothetical protein
MRDQFGVILNEERFRNINLDALPNLPNNPVISCQCGESYCSVDCKNDAFRRHHYCLCVADSNGYGEAVSEFKFFCLSIEGCGDNLLLLAQLLATLVSNSSGDFGHFQSLIADLLTFTNRPFHEVARPPSGTERDLEWESWLESTISKALELLSRALCGQSKIFEEFFDDKQAAFRVLSRFLSIFELNNIDISIPSTLGVRVKELVHEGCAIDGILREKEVVMRALWDDEAKGVYEDDYMEDEEEVEMGSEDVESDDEHIHEGEQCVDEMLESIRFEVSKMTIGDLLESEYPNFHGTGLYVSVARTNHSCTPNVTMDFDDENATITCKALRDIQQGEELRMSYISNPDNKKVSTRRAQLQDYLFTCNCDLCLKDGK